MDNNEGALALIIGWIIANNGPIVIAKAEIQEILESKRQLNFMDMDELFMIELVEEKDDSV